MLCGSITVPDLPFEWFNRVIYLYETMGRGGGKVVSALTFLSNNISSSPTKVFNKIRTKMIMSRKLKNGSGKRAQARGYVVKVEI